MSLHQRDAGASITCYRSSSEIVVVIPLSKHGITESLSKDEHSCIIVYVVNLYIALFKVRIATHPTMSECASGCGLSLKRLDQDS